MDLTKTSTTNAVSTSANPVTTSVSTKLIGANSISTRANMESPSNGNTTSTTAIKRPENAMEASDEAGKIVKKMKIDKSSLDKNEKLKNRASMTATEKSDELQMAGKKTHSKMKKDDDDDEGSSSSGESSERNTESSDDEPKDYAKVGGGSLNEGNMSAVGLGDFEETPEGCIRPGPNYQKDELQIKVPEENQNLTADNVEEGSGSHFTRASVIVWDLSRK